jgi:predicted RNase H-like HicB family nuclease
MKYVIVIEKGEEGFWGYFPDVPGCVTAGATVDDVRENAVEALESHLEGEEVPEARSLNEILADPETELEGTEVLAWVSYEQQALATV